MGGHRKSSPVRNAVVALAVTVGVSGAGLGYWLRQEASSPTAQPQDPSAQVATGSAASPAPGSSSPGLPAASPTTKTGTRTSPTAGATPSRAPSAAGTAAAAHSPSARPSRTTPAPAPKSSLPAVPAPSGATTCSKPVFTTSSPTGGWSTNGYYVHNNMWNVAEAGPETLSACSYRNWYVVSNQKNLPSNPGSVKTFPNVHKDYDGQPISSFHRITSTFAASSPHVGIYDVAYDIWLNGVASSSSTEIMIWTDNYRQVPSGEKVARMTSGGVDYDLWKVPDSTYIAFVPTRPLTSGNLDLLQMFRWLISKGWLSGTATLGQIGFGVEVVDTLGTNATFRFTDFSVTDD